MWCNVYFLNMSWQVVTLFLSGGLTGKLSPTETGWDPGKAHVPLLGSGNDFVYRSLCLSQPCIRSVALIIFNQTHIMNWPAVMTVLNYYFIPEFAYMYLYMSLHRKLGWWVSKLIFVHAHFQYGNLQNMTTNGHLNVYLVKVVCHWQALQEAWIL